MKKSKIIAVLSTILIVIGLVSVKVSALNYSTNQIVGTWKWINSESVGYPVYYEFKVDGTLNINKMKSGGPDIDKYKWSLSGNTILYTRPAADDPVVNKLVIVKLDSTILILSLYDNGKKYDLWLERI